MNNEIINKIKSRMAGELLPEQLNKLVCDSKNQSCFNCPAPPSPNKYAFSTFILSSSEYLEIKKCTS